MTQTNFQRPTSPQDYRALFNVEQQVPRLDGSVGTYINFDNAASTPPFRSVQETLNRFAEWYASVHRGAGFKSQLATRAYEQARDITMQFVGADPQAHVCIFGKNTTEAINKLAHRFPFTPERDVVLTSLMEHHSNDLPYREVAKVVHIGVRPNGELDEADFDAQLKAYAGRVALVAITGGSNVTGYITPSRRLAEKAHAAGAQIFVDCAQLAPHREVRLGALDDPTHFDYVAIAGHKMYAPYGAGALIGRRDTFAQGDPDLRGGGTVDIVTLDSAEWNPPPDRDEAGSPNVPGVVALAAAMRQLEAIGMEHVAAHEAALTARLLTQMNKIEGLEIKGNTDPTCATTRLGVVTFGVKGMSHILVASILGHEFGIGVRNGRFCAQLYTWELMGLTEADKEAVRADMRARKRTNLPGLVRASFSLYNTEAEVDYFVEALQKIVRKEYGGQYTQDPVTGDFVPAGWAPRYEDYFCLL